jgi:type IV pilus assembly protein PilB
MDMLGFREENIKILRGFIDRPQGMILITGPTGSGKTSTLYACMREVRSDAVNIITVEDPIEYEMSGINQVQINEKVGLTFPFYGGRNQRPGDSRDRASGVPDRSPGAIDPPHQ